MREGRDRDLDTSEKLLVLAIPASAISALIVSFFEPRLVLLFLFGGPCAAFVARPLRGSKTLRFIAVGGFALLLISTVVMFLEG